MAQLSRPFQIALVALVLFVLVWFVGLHRPGSTSTNPSASSSPPRPAAAHTAPHAGSAGAVSHGTHGLTRTESSAVSAAQAATHGGISGAHAVAPATHTTVSRARVVHVSHSPAVTVRHAATVTHAHTSVSVQHAATVTHTHTSVSVQRHSERPAGATHTSAPATHTASTAAPHKAAVDPRRTPSAQRGPAAAATSPATPARQAAVAAELKQGKVVLILFWNSHSSADAAVHGQVLAAAHKLGRSVAVQSATAEQVGDFGSITRDIQVYQTPTLLIVNPHGQVTTVTGYTDAYAIEQTVREARG